MLYSCTHMTTVGVKGLTDLLNPVGDTVELSRHVVVCGVNCADNCADWLVLCHAEVV